MLETLDYIHYPYWQHTNFLYFDLYLYSAVYAGDYVYYTFYTDGRHVIRTFNRKGKSRTFLNQYGLAKKAGNGFRHDRK